MLFTKLLHYTSIKATAVQRTAAVQPAKCKFAMIKTADC